MKLEPNQGIPRHIILLMSAMAGLTVANLYYVQPLLEMIRTDLGTSDTLANMIAVITQVGYALGLLFIVPTGDLFSRRKIIVVCMVIAALMTLTIGLSNDIYTIWAASLAMGACSIVPQLFIPVAGQFSRPEHKSRNMGFVLSGLLIGILAARVISGMVGEWFGWRTMYYIAGCVMVICLVGSVCQIAAWMVAYLCGDTYLGLIAALILVDGDLQCLQLSNQSACIQELPEASNRVNTIFMTTYFIGGSLGTFCAGQGWHVAGWTGICFVGALFATISLCITLVRR